MLRRQPEAQPAASNALSRMVQNNTLRL